MDKQPITNTLKIGCAFRNERDPLNHVHFIASRTDVDLVVVMNLTSIKRFKDASCQLTVGDHPSITDDTCVSYRHATIHRLMDIQYALHTGVFWPESPMSAAVMVKVFDGADRSIHFPNECRLLMSQQNLIHRDPPVKM